LQERFNNEKQNSLDSLKEKTSVGICNGCQLFMELEVINPEHEVHGKMLTTKVNTKVSLPSNGTENKSVMLSTFRSTLEFGFHMEKENSTYQNQKYNIVGKYGYEGYPANPNGSDYTAML
jgi:phosphoribosylformylglycinamidine synthase